MKRLEWACKAVLKYGSVEASKPICFEPLEGGGAHQLRSHLGIAKFEKARAHGE